MNMISLSLAMALSLPFAARTVRGRTSAVSPTVAMRTLTAILILAAWPCLHAAHAHDTRDIVQATLRSIFGEQYNPVQRLYNCSQALGPAKCLSALSVWRAERAIQAYATDTTSQFNLTEDVERFPWVKYSNASDDQLYSQLCDGTAKLMQHRSLSLAVIPGYELQLDSKGNGSMNVDIYKRDEASGRGMMKKMHKNFYKFMPFLALPGLIMAAILPFVLPGLKMLTLAAVMINNMALTGAVFTLLRNNAFNDKYEHKVVYVNKGYTNEKQGALNEEHVHTNHDGAFYSDDKPIENTFGAEHTYGEDFDAIDDMPAFSFDQGWLQNTKPTDISVVPVNHQWIQNHDGHHIL